VYRRSFRRTYEIYRRHLDGGTEPVQIASSGAQEVPTSWSHDGKRLVFTVNAPSTRRDIWYMEFSRGQSAPTRHLFASTRADEILPRVSPDGRWVAYCSDITGLYEVYLKPFPQGGNTIEVSVQGGCQPTWAPDGRELYYVEKNALMAVSLRSIGDKITPGTPKVLFRADDLVPEATDDHVYDVSPDGSTFILVERTVPDAPRAAIHYSELGRSYQPYGALT
jgi:Tol biopolymer transport system component